MMKRLITMQACALALAAAAGVAPAKAAEPGAVDLTFEVGARPGAVMAGLFDSEEAYRKDAPIQGLRVEGQGDAVKVVFPNVKPGRYAVKAFYDLNGDGKLNANAFGMPIEPYAFSNNAAPRFGPPAWSDASFAVGPGGAAQTLILR